MQRYIQQLPPPSSTMCCVFLTSFANVDNNAQTITVNHGTLEQEAEIAATGMHDNRQNCFRFQFHHVLHNAGQDTIYDGLARDVVQGAVDGISGEQQFRAWLNKTGTVCSRRERNSHPMLVALLRIYFC